MNKKAETQTGYLVPLIVALIVLALVVVGIWAISSGRINFWKDLPVPGEKNDTIKVESTTFRYIISDDAVEYYTGTEWQGFKGKSLDIGNKRVDYDDIRRQFKSYFHVIRPEERIEITRYQKKIYDGGEYGEVPWLDAVLFLIEDVVPNGIREKGNVFGVLANSANKGDSKKYGQFIVNQKGEIFINKVKPDLELEGNFKKQSSSEEPYKMIVERAIEWRDRVLKKPVELSWRVVEKGKEEKKENGKFCTEKISFQGEISLVVRLEKPANGETC
ncbi:hypothetical protein FJZ18_02720 [Candidatus Pacearchaeota archaeon]|nr:hypothetical protein [Candidatus Pacearchaeota archaeon]